MHLIIVSYLFINKISFHLDTLLPRSPFLDCPKVLYSQYDIIIWGKTSPVKPKALVKSIILGQIFFSWEKVNMYVRLNKIKCMWLASLSSPKELYYLHKSNTDLMCFRLIIYQSTFTIQFKLLFSLLIWFRFIWPTVSDLIRAKLWNSPDYQFYTPVLFPDLLADNFYINDIRDLSTTIKCSLALML